MAAIAGSLPDSIPDPIPDHWQLPQQTVLVTGANGHLGQRLLRTLAGRVPLRALVRSEAARATIDAVRQELGDSGQLLELKVGAYDDPAVLAAACEGCCAAVHLVGIIKESRSNSFAQAHVATTQTLIAAAEVEGLQRLVYLSIVGARPGHPNPALATKGDAEALLSQSAIPATVFQVPMVLGEGDYASHALRQRASGRTAYSFRAESLEQPIYAGDVVRAVIQALCDQDQQHRSLALPGPERLSRRALTDRAGQVLGKEPRLRSLPLGLGLALAALLEKTQANPPVTRAMLGVLDHDDEADDSAARAYLDFERTGLEETLRRCLA